MVFAPDNESFTNKTSVSELQLENYNHEDVQTGKTVWPARRAAPVRHLVARRDALPAPGSRAAVSVEPCTFKHVVSVSVVL